MPPPSVYPGTTIGVKLTVVEKIAQERREPEDLAKGIVRYRVEVDDHEGDVVAVATILTMVKNSTKAQMVFETHACCRLRRWALACLSLLAVAINQHGLAQTDLDSLDSWVRHMQPDPFVRCGELPGFAPWMTRENVGWGQIIWKKYASPTPSSGAPRQPHCRVSLRLDLGCGTGVWDAPHSLAHRRWCALDPRFWAPRASRGGSGVDIEWA